MSGSGFGIVRPGGPAELRSPGASMKSLLALLLMVIAAPDNTRRNVPGSRFVEFESGRS
jgi:hypothetical protein